MLYSLIAVSLISITINIVLLLLIFIFPDILIPDIGVDLTSNVDLRSKKDILRDIDFEIESSLEYVDISPSTVSSYNYYTLDLKGYLDAALSPFKKLFSIMTCETKSKESYYWLDIFENLRKENLSVKEKTELLEQRKYY